MPVLSTPKKVELRCGNRSIGEVILELRKFIRVSLFEIIWGINDAHEDFADSGCAVKFMENKPTKTSAPNEDHYHNINFNIAVTVDEESEPPSSKLIVVGLTQLGSGSYEQLLLLVSRIEFTIPISFTPPLKEKYSDLKNQYWLNYSH